MFCWCLSAARLRKIDIGYILSIIMYVTIAQSRLYVKCKNVSDYNSPNTVMQNYVAYSLIKKRFEKQLIHKRYLLCAYL